MKKHLCQFCSFFSLDFCQRFDRRIVLCCSLAPFEAFLLLSLFYSSNCSCLLLMQFPKSFFLSSPYCSLKTDEKNSRASPNLYSPSMLSHKALFRNLWTCLSDCGLNFQMSTFSKRILLKKITVFFQF